MIKSEDGVCGMATMTLDTSTRVNGGLKEQSTSVRTGPSGVVVERVRGEGEEEVKSCSGFPSFKVRRGPFE